MAKLSAKALLDLANKSLQHGDHSLAHEYCSSALELEPMNPEVNHLLGFLTMSVGHDFGALKYFRHAIKIDETTFQYWKSLIGAFLKLGAHDDATFTLEKVGNKDIFSPDELMLLADMVHEYEKSYEVSNFSVVIAYREEGNYLKAIELQKSLIEIEPDNSDYKANLSHLLLLIGKIPDAKSCMAAAKLINPHRPLTLWNEARLLLHMKKVIEAESVLRSALVEFPNSNDGKILLAAALKAQNKLEESEQYLNQILRFNAKHAEAYAQRGMILLSKNKYEFAFDDLRKAYELKPHISQIWPSLCDLSIEYKQFELSEKVLQNLISHDPKQERYWYLLGDCRRKLQKIDPAIHSYKMAIDLNPKFSEAYNSLGVLLKTKKDIKSAIEMYRSAIRVNSNYAEAHYNLGSALFAQKMLDESIIHYKSALEIQPDFPEAYYNLGKAYEAQKKLTNAETSYKSAIRLRPNYADAYNNLGNLLVNSGQLDLAIGNYEIAIRSAPKSEIFIENLGSLLIQKINTQVNDIIQLHNLLEKEKITPKAFIQLALKAFMDREFDVTNLALSKFDQSSFNSLDSKDSRFCYAYHTLISNLLLKVNLNAEKPSDIIFHLGESHCLSYAHHLVQLNGECFQVKPVLTIGAKAFHFKCGSKNRFEAITRKNLHSIRRSSTLFVSFGEIDCRPNEGFLRAASKKESSIDKLIHETVSDYINWFDAENKKTGHFLHFFNVPAPIYNNKLTQRVNEDVRDTVQIFNEQLDFKTQEVGFKLIDVYSHTKNEQGFSNNRFHIDEVHLSPDLLEVMIFDL